MIFAIKPFEIHDGDGIRTTIFFKGCPLRCKWCHNPESFSFQKEISYNSALCKNCMRCTEICKANKIQDGRHIFDKTACNLCGKCMDICPNKAFELMGNETDAAQIAKQVCKDKLFFQNSGGGVTFSGGEPLMQIDLCVELAKLFKEQNINIAIDTSGFVPREHIDRILPYADTFLFDIKAIDRDVHMACTGVPNERILANIQYVDSMGIPMEIRYPYVTTMNDGEWKKIAAFVKELKNMKLLRILPYHNYAEQKYHCLGMPEKFQEYPIPPISEIDGILEKIKEMGIPNAGRF